MQARIIGHSLSEEEDYVIYHVQCTYENQIWQVDRRYNEFNELYEKLMDKGTPKESIGTVPAKLWWGNMKEENILVRREGLQVYLASLLENKKTQYDPDVCEFLAVKFEFDEEEDRLVAVPTKQKAFWNPGQSMVETMSKHYGYNTSLTPELK
ncbi:Nisch [Acrasis kona]|uniref:Nisch n=1 Tax=Acrasis kona TaxID=1008807 RepID=A0AAW2ZEE3_9EUKA